MDETRATLTTVRCPVTLGSETWLDHLVLDGELMFTHTHYIDVIVRAEGVEYWCMYLRCVAVDRELTWKMM